jgi:hypothetical protein
MALSVRWGRSARPPFFIGRYAQDTHGAAVLLPHPKQGIENVAGAMHSEAAGPEFPAEAADKMPIAVKGNIL